MGPTTCLSGRVGVLKLHGRFDAHVAPEVKTWIDRPGAPNQIVIDLSGVNFIDSTALATLVSVMKRCRQHSGDLHLCGIQQPVRIIFELTRLDRAFAMFSDETMAVGAFEG